LTGRCFQVWPAPRHVRCGGPDMEGGARGRKDRWNGGGSQPAACVLGSGQNGLGVFRSLGRRGIPVMAVHPDAREVALASRYCRAAVSPPVEDAQAYVQFLMELAGGFAEPPVLIPTSDPTVVVMSEHRDILKERFRFVLPGRDVVTSLINKREFDGLARAHGLPVPQTFFAATAEGIRRKAAEVSYPAAYSGVIAVGATSSTNAVASWSSSASYVALCAPGVLVFSTYKGSSYATFSGTSMATPHVSGVAALVLTTDASASAYGDGDAVWEPSEVKAVLQGTATDIGAAANSCGAGLVDAAAAVA